MPRYYTYLISSLPLLQFSRKLPFSFAAFIGKCRGFVTEKEIDILKFAYKSYADGKQQPTLRRWFDFDVALRNELVKVRASRKHLDPLKYIRGDGYTDPSIAHLALAAYRNPSIIESEQMLDQARWNFLDQLAVGHYFDLDFLIIYVLKLSILERWERINTAQKSAALEDLLQKVSKG